ncbi:MAG: ankyrin repeat domain-containing protein [Verrucomicrobia bacterium]|nr:ankyrin repeat domain-containing protein [Verrucomicrobiota bacterium]
MTKKNILILSGCALGWMFAVILIPLARNFRYEELRAACRTGHVGTVRLLLILGADPNGKKDYKPSWTAEFSYPIEGAAQNNYPEIIHLLVKAGANVNVDVPGEGYEESPLCITAREGATEAAQALLTHGAWTTTRYGTSALAVARRRGHEEIARLIEASSQIQPNQ